MKSLAEPSFYLLDLWTVLEPDRLRKPA